MRFPPQFSSVPELSLGTGAKQKSLPLTFLLGPIDCHGSGSDLGRRQGVICDLSLTIGMTHR